MSLHPPPFLHSTLIPELELLLETFGSAETSVCTERLRYFNANLHWTKRQKQVITWQSTWLYWMNFILSIIQNTEKRRKYQNRSDEHTSVFHSERKLNQDGSILFSKFVGEISLVHCAPLVSKDSFPCPRRSIPRGLSCSVWEKGTRVPWCPDPTRIKPTGSIKAPAVWSWSMSGSPLDLWTGPFNPSAPSLYQRKSQRF